MFITFEGGEGTGKSTQVKLLAERLRAQGRDVLTTREPGGTPEAEALRKLLVSGDIGRWNSDEEALLNFAARSTHIRQVIRPALAANKIVICDRFMDSTFVYQVFAGHTPFEFFQELRKQIVGQTMPTVTFVLDIDPAVGILRSRNRMASQKIISEELVEDAVKLQSSDLIGTAVEVSNASQEDRFERKDIDFHRKVHDGFRALANADPTRCILIDASHTIDVVANHIWTALHVRK
jgi:dTMP kinase